MRKFFKFAIAVLAIVTALVSCSKLSEDAYYTFEPKINVKGSSGEKVSAIETALGNRHHSQYKSESEARKEWDAFLSAVDDKAVIITLDDSYYTVSLVLKDSEGDTYVTKKTLASVTWDKDGRHVK